MVETLLLKKGRFLNFTLTFIASFFLVTTSWGQTVTTDKDDYAPGEYVIITGTDWEPGERVDFTFVETPKPETCVNSHDNFAIADASGNIFYNGFLIKENHIGVHFVLTATGQSSDRIAVTEFTDANVTFNASGLPSGSTNQITVSWNVTGTGILPSPSSGNYQFNYPGPSNPAIAVRTTQTITYSFSNVIISGTIYSAPAGSASGNNNGNGAQVITAVYTALACVPPSINTPPTAKTITYGDLNPIYSVTASGDGLSYQWQYNTEAVPGTWVNVGTNSNNYTVPAPDVSFSGRTYRVVITGTCATVTSTPVLLTVNKKALTVTAANNNKNYGDAVVFAGSEFTAAGLTNSDGVTSVTLASDGAAAGASVNGSPYTIVASAAVGSGLSNYTISYVNGTLSVTAAELTITATDDSREYGEANPAFVGTYSGQKNGETFTVGGASDATATSAVGDYDIVPSVTGATLGNYTVAKNNGTLSVTAAELTITATDDSREYGEANPAFVGTYSGQKNGETFTVGGASDATATSAVGDYDIVPSVTGATLGNYTVAKNNGTLSVTAAELTITATDDSREYGEANPAFVGTYSGQKNGETFTVGAASDATATSAVGDYDIVPSVTGATLGNYTVAKNNGTLSVTAAELTITATDDSREYGEANPAFVGTYSGQKNGETFTVGGASDATATSAVGDYDIVPSVTGATLGNYTVAKNNGTLSVTAAELTITATDDSREYGEANPAFVGTYSGQKNGETFTVGGASDATATSAVGDYDIVPSVTGATLGNYTVAKNNGTLSVTAAELTITATDDSREYGEANPAFVGTYSGQKNGETFTVGGASDATATSAVGDYDIVPSVTGATLGNYTVAKNNGTLSVTKAALTVTVIPATKFAGQKNPDFQVNYSGFVNNDDEYNLSGILVFATSADRSTCADEYDVTPSGLTSENYLIDFNKGTITVHAVAIDARYSNTSVQLNSPNGVVLSATVFSSIPGNIKGILVKFLVDGVQAGTGETNESGVATFTYNALSTTAVKEITTVIGNDCAKDNAYLSIYDPNGGFVTGGGWIESPANAMASGIEGKANFGFNAKYKTGKNTLNEVDGNTNFQFKAGDFHFSSTSHTAAELIISGSKATYTGRGTVNGTGNYNFRVVAIDGALTGNGAEDKFRIKVWADGSQNNPVYDNQRGKSESGEDATVIGGGSIVIHKPKPSGKTAETTKTLSLEKGTSELTQQPVQLDILGNLAVAPNPVRTDAKVRFSLIEDAGVTVRLFDFNGREIYNLYSGNAKANEVYEVGFQRNNMMSGIYIVRLTTDRGQSYTKNVIVE